MQKSWMWHNESSNGVEAATIDLEDNRIQWFDEPGCSCSGSQMEQTVDDFRENGPRFIMPPADVLEEMQTMVRVVPST